MHRVKSKIMLLKKSTKLKVRFLVIAASFLLFIIGVTSFFTSYSDLILEFNDDVDYIESAVKDNKVIVNDLESDYYYYMGLNYTDNDGGIPTTVNKDIYNDSNLVQAKITYNSDDGNNKGYVSLNERQDTYVYFKTFVVNNNNTDDFSDDYVLIKLIDNPFSDRPDDRAFNGWQTSYNGAFISYDNDYYERYVKVPVTYSDNKPLKIDIVMTAKWTDAKVSYVDSNFNTAIADLNSIGMQKLESVRVTYEEVDMSGYFYQVTLNRDDSCSGYYNANGRQQNYNCTCNPRNSNTCTYYQKIENEFFDEDNTYYYLSNNRMTVLDNSTIDRDVYEEVNTDLIDSNMSTYYKKVSIGYNNSISGYYDDSGNYISSGTCSSYGGCTYYELLQYYKDDGTEEIFDSSSEYYYLVTRDTNILVVNKDITGSWSDNGDYPFTVTSLHNGTKYDVSWTANSAVHCYNDTVIENIKVYYGSNVNSTYNPPSGTSTSGVLYGDFNNVRIGRGITKNGNYYTFRAVIGGSNSSTGSNNSPSKYRFVIESGFYNSISLTNGASNSLFGSRSLYVNNESVYGNDYDRVKNDNDNLTVYYCASGSWSGNIYATSNNATSSDISLNLTVKSGSFGTSKYDHSTGIYVGGRYGGTHYAARSAKIEGGYIYNLIGGPLTSSNRSSVNDTYIYMTGGEVDMITGGAGTTATYGNRIISITGGTINYSVFGGSNGYNGSDGDGTVNGSSYIYIGGTATIGDEDLVSSDSTLFGAEAGSVFGIGNGKSGSSTIGSSDNSNIVINDKAVIYNNVYGGGNYGATGVSSSLNTTNTNIVMEDGIVYGSIYGGGNKNGSGSSSTLSSVNINMNGGNVVGSIYGGSNDEGTIYGSVYINVKAGEIASVYGGGRGGLSSSSNGTFVRDNIDIVIGESLSSLTPIINNAVYGGSAFGTVNGEVGNDEVSSYSTKVTVNKGIILNVFGGGEGNSDYTPYVKGDITVDINGGVITNVFGGNDDSGYVNGNVVVNINDGSVTSTYGGGNKTPVKITNVNLNGGVSTNIYGGSNVTGDVNVSNIVTNGGTANYIYGGNNIGGETDVSNITINGGDIDTVYGGGNETSIGTSTNVNLNGLVNNLFGGSNVTGDVPLTNIVVSMGSANNIYGGNNKGGVTTDSYITINGGVITNVFGGGLKADTGTSNINFMFGKVTNIYGGGDEASVSLTNINLGNGIVSNIYGGSNSSGNVNTSNILNTTPLSNGLLTVSSSFTKGQLPTWDNMGSSATISTTVNNNTGVRIVKWDLYLLTSESEFESNWSSAKVEVKNNMYYISEINNYYGTNEIASGSGFSFDFNIQSYLDIDEFTIYGYMIKGYDSDGNEYIGSSFDTLDIEYIYGGNNKGGVTTGSNINLTRGVIDYIFGGGKSATTGNSNVNLDGVFVTKAIYGGGDFGSITSVNLSINDSEIGSNEIKANVYGGGNKASVNGTITTVIDNDTKIYGDFYSGGNEGSVNDIITTNINNSYVSDNIFGGGNKASVGNNSDSEVTNLNIYNTTTCNVYGGGNAASVNGSTNVILRKANITCNVYGGGNGLSSATTGDDAEEDNPAKVYGNTNLLVDDDTTIADSVYGGGNLGMIEGSTNVTIKASVIDKSVYGGGNAAVVRDNTNVYISSPTINESVYAGGNGITAIVRGNTNLNIDNGSIINKHVFGGGNAAATGTSEVNNSLGVVNIVGATILGNVYGGANTSVLYGETTVNIGSGTVNERLIDSDIYIGGTIFGGGEANASGSEDYDYSFISVTKGITINIDGSGYDVFDTRGSIFGSGNASSTTGYSYIYIKNYGTTDDVKHNISIQRADVVMVDNSYISLSGTTDRTNEYSSVLFTLSRIDELKLVNDSSLFLEEGTNLLKKISSLALVNGDYEVAVVDIDNDNGTINRNVNNRIYMIDGKNKNIKVATDESALTYGEVSGMTFFGLYSKDNNGNPITALYSDYSYGDVISSGDIYYFTNGSYVLGSHKTNHDITKDGFYTNYPDEEGNNSIVIKYIDPIPEDADFYTWVIGETVVSYDFELVASKFATLGTYELSLRNYAKENTTFAVLGVNYSNLSEDIKLVNYDEIPRVAESTSMANGVFGLSMKSGQKIINNGTTNFVTEGDSIINGTTSYITENTSSAPSFVFYLYHSKNISDEGNLGVVTISLAAITPVDELNNEIQRINIDITLTKTLIDSNKYEGTITTGEQYEMFASSPVNITTKSSFSTYYSLYMESENNPYKDGYHRAFVSTYALPVNTKITMIDFAEEAKPVYYYYVVSEDDYDEYLSEYNLYGEVSYKLSRFIKMGSTSLDNNYDDESANIRYYNNGIAEEEFIFIINFEDCDITSDVLDKKMLMELRNGDDQVLIGLLQDTLRYNLYTDSSAIIELSASMSKDTIYRGDSTNLTIDTNFVQSKNNSTNIVDTNYDEEKLGIKMFIVDSSGNTLTSSSLMGVNYSYDGNTYYPRYDGTVRINIAERVANVRSKIVINTENSNLSTGEYTLVIESFGSADGIYYGLESSDREEIKFYVIDNLYGLKIDVTDNMIFIDKDTGFTGSDNNSYVYKVYYTSGLYNPCTTIKLLRRNYSSIYTNVYDEVDLKDYVTNSLDNFINDNEYYLSKNPTSESTNFLYFKDNLLDGTYKLVVSLYDNNNYIGDMYQYIIIK